MSASTNDFFSMPSEQSLIKADIVSSYFGAWANVIKSKWSHSIPIGYLDLFCGPGIYQDGTESVPIRLIRTILSDKELSSRMILAFNDEDPQNIESLRSAIESIDTNKTLAGKIQYSISTVGDEFYKRIQADCSIPIFSFVDPFGYKGLTRTLIQTLIQNNGSDCIFFFNYSRINMALSSNTKFDSYLAGIFGEERTAELKKKLEPLSAEDREPVVIDALIDALKETRAKSVLPFKFYRTDMHRTSHYIIFVSKNLLACRIMKNVMYNVSAKDSDGIASFEYHDQANFGDDYQQMGFFDTPFQILCNELLTNNSGKTVRVKDLCERYENSYTNRFVSKNVKDALNKLEDQERLTVTGRKKMFVRGKKTMPDAALVTFK